MGNAAADRAANAERAKFHLPSAAEYAAFHRQTHALKELLQYAAEALLLFPTPTKGKKSRLLVQTAPASTELQSGMLSGLEALFQHGAYAGTAGLSAPASLDADLAATSATVPEPSVSDAPAPSDAPTSTCASGDMRLGAGAPSSSSASRDSHATSAGYPLACTVKRRIRGKQAARLLAPELFSVGDRVEVPPPPCPQEARPVCSAHSRTVHSWTPARLGGRWICIVCFRGSRLQVPPQREECRGLAPKLVDLIRDRKQHNISCSEYPGGVLFFCTRCGGVSEGKRLENLGRPCKVRPQSGKTATNLSRIARLMQPTSKGAHGDSPVLTPPVSLDTLLSA